MNRDEARSAAARARRAAKVPERYRLTGVELRIIEVPAFGKPAAPAPVRDWLVWIASFQDGTALIEVALDDASGNVVRVE